MKYKHLHSFTDRHGNPCIYYRKPGCRSIRLPSDINAPGFAAAYRDAEKGMAAEASRKSVEKQAEWSGRRLKKSIRETCADSGVYLLIHRGKVSYVGSSQNCAARIAAHRTNGRAFDKAYYIFAERSEMVRLEAILIAAIQPPQNKVVPSAYKLSATSRSVCENSPEAID